MNEIIDGRYRIIKRIGQGAFGQVYLAEDANVGAGRKVVVKLSPSGINFSEREIFEREARVSARLHHANIAAITDFGVTEDGRAFLVREYVEGMPLEELLIGLRLKNSKLEQSNALAVISAIAEGLSEAHRNNIIHRDLKPGNVAIPVFDGQLMFAKAKILDFGVFGDLIDKGTESSTRAGDIYGTPKYMSPEQFRADEQTTATDIYGLGMLLYEMIFNRLPFAENTLTGVMRASIEGNLEFPSDHKVAPGILALIKDCLKRDKKDRIQTADEVIRRIEALRQPEIVLGIESPPTGEPSVPQRFELPEDFSRPTYQGPPVVAGYPSIPYSTPEKASASSIKILCYALLVGFLIPFTILLVWLIWDYLTWGTLSGVIFVALGIAAGFAARHLIKTRRNEIGKDAQDLIFGTKSRDMLTQSLAIQVDALLAKLSRMDDKILGMSLAIMVREFEETKEADKRPNVLMMSSYYWKKSPLNYRRGMSATRNLSRLWSQWSGYCRASRQSR